MLKTDFDAITVAISRISAELGALDLAGYVDALRRDASFGFIHEAPLVWSGRRAICACLESMGEAAIALARAGRKGLEQAQEELVKQAARAERGG